MPSGLDEDLGLLGYWLDDMPSGHLDSSDSFSHLGHLGHLGYLGLLGHLGYLGLLGHLGYLSLLGHLGYLNVLDPKPIDLPLHTSIQEEEDT
jgi:hypothetical protein